MSTGGKHWSDIDTDEMASLKRSNEWSLAELEAVRADRRQLIEALQDCMEIAGSDCEHELCKAIIERASAVVNPKD